jgi:hypothetical protein
MKRLFSAALAGSLLLLSTGAALATDQGERIEHRLDRRGDRIEHRMDRRGERIERRMDRRGDRAQSGLDRRAAHQAALGN